MPRLNDQHRLGRRVHAKVLGRTGNAVGPGPEIPAIDFGSGLWVTIDHDQFSGDRTTVRIGMEA
jgi:hypothetical protein